MAERENWTKSRKEQKKLLTWIGLLMEGEGGGIERLVLESNPVEFDILPRDPAWEAQLFAENVRILDSMASMTEHIQALRSLVLLDSPAAAEKIAQLYLQLYAADSSTRNTAEVSEIDRGLLESSHLEVIIPLLEGALSSYRPLGYWTALGRFAVPNQELGTIPSSIQHVAAAGICHRRRPLDFLRLLRFYPNMNPNSPFWMYSASRRLIRY